MIKLETLQNSQNRKPDVKNEAYIDRVESLRTFFIACVIE